MNRRRRIFGTFGLAAALAVTSAACSSGSGDGVALTGAGSTFAQPMYATWSKAFLGVESGAKINYQAIGSGGGVQQFTAKSVAFGATDVPLQTEEISALKGAAYIEFPTVLGAVTVVYHTTGVPNGLNLDGTTLADIFLGKVTKWNDPEITALNSGVSLPATPIQTVHRADESGTTAVFTGWLAKQSSTWSSQIGAGKSVQWSGGTSANGNDGVAAGVSQGEGTIGYVSYDFAVTAHLTFASMKAPSGQFVAPSTASISAAGGGLQFPITPTTNILDSTTTGAYPIASTTYVLIYKDQTDEKVAQTLVDFWTWALTKGQASATSVNYAPLPSNIATQSLQQVASITANGKAVKASSKV
ncbi:MAG TPA: phosphate ABC transporter substrate-binding protein PstS [Actinobacteria bacterium]|jgi:phosphate transport system substrate-binding protein|nr:phosphate ABC transporter substrate-binding protein PstS [Actinomycetota bacterium]